jgi:hypothetical protein
VNWNFLLKAPSSEKRALGLSKKALQRKMTFYESINFDKLVKRTLKDSLAFFAKGP